MNGKNTQEKKLKKNFTVKKNVNNRPKIYMSDRPKTFLELQKKEKELKKMDISKKQVKKKEDQLAYGLHHKYLGLTRKPFYSKEYVNNKSVYKTIMKESIKLLIFVSLLSTVGGMFLESIKESFITILPLLIILPALNGMIGNYGSVVSSRMTTMLHKGTVLNKWWSDPKVKKILAQIFILSIITAMLVSFASLILSAVLGFALDSIIVVKIFSICIIETAILIMIISLVSIITGIYFHKKHEDPDNFLIPITTTIADFGSILILFLLILLLF